MTAFRDAPDEKARIASLMRMLPSGTRALEIGARDGYITKLLANQYDEVVALDLERPSLELPRVTCVAGDVRELNFPPDSYDVVVCSEVLEHIPPKDLARACDELIRVTKRHLIIGVPFEQDLRVARTLCAQCGLINPPYGHVNRFDQARLESLFVALRISGTEQIGSTREGTNWLSDLLMRLAGYPWGSYEQDEPCIGCGAAIGPAPKRSLTDKILSALAIRIDRIARKSHTPRAKWLHATFVKESQLSKGSG